MLGKLKKNLTRQLLSWEVFDGQFTIRWVTKKMSRNRSGSIMSKLTSFSKLPEISWVKLRKTKKDVKNYEATIELVDVKEDIEDDTKLKITPRLVFRIFSML